MSTHNANKQYSFSGQFTGFMKLSLLAFATFLISGCMGVECKLTEQASGEVHQCVDLSGNSNVPVVYVNPENNGVYEFVELVPEVEFPNGVPTSPEFILNGADVTADFNCAGTTCTALPIGPGPGQANAIQANLRDGRNAFQVAKPQKAMIFFNMNMPGAEVHILSVDDGWTGETFRINRTCSGEVCTRDVNGTNVARRFYTGKRGNMVVTGYLEGEGYKNITQMCVNTFSMNASGNLSSLAGLNGGSMCDAPGGAGASETGGYYLNFYDDYTFDFNIRDTGDNDLVYTENETDMIEITVQDSLGSYSTRWLRSNAPIWDSRMGSDGGFSISFDKVAMLSTGLGVADLLHGLVIAGYGEPTIPVTGGFEITELYLGNDSTFQITIPATQNSNTVGRIDVDANLEMRIYVSTPFICFGDMSSGTRNSFFPYNAEISLSIDKSGTGFGDVAPYITNVGIGGDGINLSGIGGGLCGAFLSVFQGLVDDTVSGIVGNVIGGIVANDIPTMRAKVGVQVPTGSGSSDFGPFYLTLHPEVTDFYAIPKGGSGPQPGVKWGLMMGMHTRGVNAARHSDVTQRAQRNASLGIKWSGVPSVATKARLAANLSDESVAANSTTLGAMLTQDFVNQLLLGLWESGFVFFDQMQFAIPGGGTDPFLDNLNLTFATRMPWEIQFYPDGHPAGDAQLYFPDLVVQMRGDLYYPEFQPNYNFATMVADIYFNVNIDGSPDGTALRISVANTLEIEVQEVSSDWDNTSEDQLIAALDSVFTDLSAGLNIDIPFPEILSSAVDIKGVYSDAQGLYVPIDVYNAQRYPDGPDGNLFDVSFYTINASNSNTGSRNLVNGVDDNLNVSPGLYPFHLTARNRNYTRDTLTTGCDQWGGNCDTTPYYYTEASFDWGFEHRFNGTYRLKSIGVDKRNDCCANRGNNILVQVRSGGVWQSVGTTSQGGNGVETISFTPRDVDRVRYLVLRTATSPAGNGSSGPWVSNGDKLGNVGDGGRTMNITETTYTFEPIL